MGAPSRRCSFASVYGSSLIIFSCLIFFRDDPICDPNNADNAAEKGFRTFFSQACVVAIWLIYMRKIVGAAPHFCFHFVPARSSPSKEYTRCCAFELLLVFLFSADMYSKSFLVWVPDFTIFRCTPGGAFIIILFFSEAFATVCATCRRGHAYPQCDAHSAGVPTLQARDASGALLVCLFL